MKSHYHLFLFLSSCLMVSCQLTNLAHIPLVIPASGKQTSLHPLGAGDSTVVLIFLSAECPICQKYTLTLRQLANEYPQVPIIGVFTRWDRPEEIKNFADTYQLPITLLKDEKHRLVRALKPSTTPEVFVLDAQQQVRYRGAIDNWFSGLGKYRPVITEYYLKDALNALSKGDTVKVKVTQPVGCLIQQ